jgi:hypothetical protein
VRCSTAPGRLGFATADGMLHIAAGEAWRAVAAHDGGLLSAAADARDGWLTAATTGS